jgi:hypothetical protein
MSFETRDFHGFFQHREIVEGVPLGAWKFNVSSFGNDDKDCFLLMTDGSLTRVPIDKDDRITVNGRLYGRENWHH